MTLTFATVSKVSDIENEWWSMGNLFTDFYQLIPLSSTCLCTFYNGVSMGKKLVNISAILIQSLNVST